MGKTPAPKEGRKPKQDKPAKTAPILPKRRKGKPRWVKQKPQ